SMADILEIHEFFVEGTNQERSHVLLHITEPGTPEERAKGYFFAVAEINNGPLEQIEHLQQMIDDLESGYYETDDQPGKNAFEITLEYLNRRGHHVLQYKNAITNCLVGVLRGKDLYFAQHGHPHAVLFYQSKDGLEQMEVTGGESDPASGQLFPSVMQGQLNTGDYFYIATPHVIDFFTFDRVAKILLTRNTRQSATHIQKVLGDLGSELSFGGILFHFPTSLDMPKTGKRPIQSDDGSAASLQKLASQEKTTEEIMKSSVVSNFGKKWQAWRAIQAEKTKKRALENVQEKRKRKMIKNQKGHIETNFRPREDSKEPMASVMLVAFGRGLVWCLSTLWRLIKKTVIFIGKFTIALILLITNKDGKRQDVLRVWRHAWYVKKEKFSDMPMLSKILFVLTVLLALVFLGSIATFKIKTSYAAKKTAYNNAAQAIIDKKAAAEASIIYGDDSRALLLLQEAKAALNGLSDSGKTRKNKKTELAKSVEEALSKLRKLAVVTSELVIDLAQQNPKAQTTGLVQIDKTMLAYGVDDNFLYKIDAKAKTAELKDHTGFSKLSSASTPKENDFVTFLTGDKEIASYDKNTSILTKKDITYPNENSKLSSICVYNRKLYTVDTNNNQIYKHVLTQTGFDRGSLWLKDSADVKDAISIAVDGDVFVLKQNGELLKLTGGLKQDFALSGVDPRLDRPTIVWTYNNVNNIYILEPTNKRVVMTDKTGKLVAQYTANEWKKPTGMIVDEAGKKIFVLDDNKIYKFTF
ncbi:hypothetical protein HY932_00610, partial [Candidatus Falkowbacteria bacterium]|nr:hypothetical protein [Candidatus Falkowbacteria bacterium]